MTKRVILGEDEAYDLLAYLLSSAETSLVEPHLNAVLRLVEAACRLTVGMAQHSSDPERQWLEQFGQVLTTKKGWVTKDPVAGSQFIREANTELAVELKRWLSRSGTSAEIDG